VGEYIGLPVIVGGTDPGTAHDSDPTPGRCWAACRRVSQREIIVGSSEIKSGVPPDLVHAGNAKILKVTTLVDLSSQEHGVGAAIRGPTRGRAGITAAALAPALRLKS
jgi:hypothetical protein